MIKRFSSLKMNGGPVYTSIDLKIRNALNPIKLVITDDSTKHAHHQAMAGREAKETHFRVLVVSDEFKSKTLVQRHRMIYKLLEDELAGSVHALSLDLKTSNEFK